VSGPRVKGRGSVTCWLSEASVAALASVQPSTLNLEQNDVIHTHCASRVNTHVQHTHVTHTRDTHT
jgi:hypothetical protein